MSRPPCGVFLLDKPAGMSSNAALQRVKQLFGANKAGHTGSLDPLASGMLPICLGEATKIAAALLDARKQYRFTIELGARTASGDLEHEVIERKAVPALQGEEIDATLAQFIGGRTQVPPMHSALKQQGKRLYELARRGIEVDRPARSIEISELTQQSWDLPHLTLTATCSKGTYIRVLAEDIAAALGTCGHVVALHRLWTAPFDREPMVPLEHLEHVDAEQRGALLLAIDYPLQSWPRVDLEEGDAVRIGHGQVLQWDAMIPPVAGAMTPVRLYGPGAQFLGIGEISPDGRLKPKRLMELGL